MLRSTTVVVCCFSAGVLFAQAPRDTAIVLDSVAREVARLGPGNGPSIWFGYRPDTIPLVFVLPTRGSLLFNWRGTLPTGYAPVAGMTNVAWHDARTLGAASTNSQLDGRAVAQVALGPAQALEPAWLFATAFHEAFHVFERASIQEDKRFGGGENAILVATYPVFDPHNETLFALEGKALRAATDATSLPRKRELAREFVGVRRARHRRLPMEFADFDQMSELNEGLANYALVRAYGLILADGPMPWRAAATRQLAAMRSQLDDLTGNENLSLRFRFYLTGPAQALLLDDLAGQQWKARVTADNWTLQDALAVFSGVDSAAERSRAQAEKAYNVAAIGVTAERRIEKLRVSRLAKVDSVLSGPGLRLVLAADSLGRDFNSCGYDPQNLLQVTAKIQIQTRWWKPCAGGPTYAEFNVPSVHDSNAGTVSAVIGPAADIKLTAGGEVVSISDGETLRDLRMFKLEAPRASVDAVRADVTRRGNVITVYPKRTAP
jgi:hypothetical protein